MLELFNQDFGVQSFAFVLERGFMMIQLNNPALKRALIEKHHFQDYFSLDLESCTSLLYYEAGESLCHSGQLHPTVMLLADGDLIASSITKSGKLHCELQYHSPNILGLTSAIWNKPVINNIEVLTPCLCLSISVELYGKALRQDVKFLNFACLYLADHIRKNAMHYEQLPTRLAQFILREQKDGYFNYSIKLCADVLETSQRHLLRTLRAFCDMGILEHVGRSHYKILDAGRLEIQ